MRSTAFIKQPSEDVLESINLVKDSLIRFVVDPKGPTRFIITPHESKYRFTVSIGSQQKCSCPESEVCIHIIYVMMKIFNVPSDCDILWQSSLTEYEIDQILTGRLNRVVKPPQPVLPNEIRKTKG